jgi:hypothetical protein
LIAYSSIPPLSDFDSPLEVKLNAAALRILYQLRDGTHNKP